MKLTLHKFSISAILILFILIQGYSYSQGFPERVITSEKWREGIGFRLIWLESRDEEKPSRVNEFVFPIGCGYDSQKIFFTKSIHPNCKVSEDQWGNNSISIDNPIVVQPDVPLLLGFVAGIEMYKDAYLIIDKSYSVQNANYPDSIKNEFLTNNKEYDLNNLLMKQVSSKVTSVDKQPIHRIKDVWEYVKSTMKYGTCKRPNTAVDLLKTKVGACGEFTRLTSAMLRASGVPSREIHSLRLSSSGPKFEDHGWTEAYLPDIGWIPVHSQEKFPEDYKFRFNLRDYFVVYRGTDYKTQHRFIKTDNVTTLCSYGVGYFADVPKSAQLQTAKLLQQISGSTNMGSAKILKKIQNLPSASRPILYWALSACKDKDIGEKAAAELVKMCDNSNGELLLEQFLEFSPSIVWTRLMSQSSLVDKDIKRFNRHKYKFFKHKMSWHRAKTSCEAFGGHLVTISSQEEQDFTATLPPKLDKDNRVWIGFSERGSEGNWEWVTGEKVSFQNWAAGLPDNLRGNQDCAEMGYAGKRWNDREHFSRFAFICEWD